MRAAGSVLRESNWQVYQPRNGKANGKTCVVDVQLQPVHSRVGYRRLAITEERVLDLTSVDWTGHQVWGLDICEELHGGSSVSEIPVAERRCVSVHALHHNNSQNTKLEGEIDVGDPYRGRGVAVHHLCDVVLSAGFGHCDIRAEFEPGIGLARAVDERDTSYVTSWVGGLCQREARFQLFHNFLGTRKADRLIGSFKFNFDTGHSDR
jgi:hypothetical protein